MTSSERVRLLLAAVVAGLGLVAAGLALGLPWLEPEFRLGAPIRILMALAGAAIMIIAGWPDSTRSTVVRRVIALLGLTVLVYPTTLSLAVSGRGGPVVENLGWGGHVLPLVLVQVLPVLASQVATGRSRRRWLVMIIVVAAVGLAATILILAGISDGAVLVGVSSVLWIGSFALAPIATWSNVRGASGETRRRAIVAGLASVIPVVIIALCATLGAAAETQDLSGDASVTALMAGFALATVGSAALTAAATGPDAGWLVRRRVVVVLLAVLLVAATMLVAGASALGALDAGLGGAGASLTGIVLVVVIGLAALRLFGWAARAVDPRAELSEQIAAAGMVADGEHLQTLQHAVRRSVGDPGLTLLARAADGSWVNPYGVVVGAPVDGFALAGGPDRPTLLAIDRATGTDLRLSRLGDCSSLAQPAILEASAGQEARRADAAAATERARLRQDLHDGLQGRLLGLALNLQLSGREVEDPSARLLVEQTVASLRDAVEDVRALAGGRLPVTLVDGGLLPALTDLVRPLTTVVDLQVPDRRFAAEVEATGYFVVGEAVSNAIKHSAADRVTVRVEQVGAALLIMVSDDGVGGADPRLGSGLRGLSERVAASGGALVVRDGVPTGTVVEASMPCGS